MIFPILATWSLLAGGCVPAYVPPSATDPHAILKVRRVYERTAGTKLTERWLLNGHEALSHHIASDIAAAPLADSVLAFPVVTKVEVKSGFSHEELRTVNETYQEQVPYTTYESYSCGTGTSYRTCTRSVTQYRSENRTRWVTRMVPVSDGECSQELFVSPEVNHTYLVDFTYRDNRVCSATCVEQMPGATAGEFDTRACPVPTAAQIAAAGQ
jgi:hypothetical protein